MKPETTEARFHDGDGATVKKGKINKNQQRCCGTLGVPGTDHNAVAYKMECMLCGFVYGANSGDVFERKCPNCQGGKPGIRFWLIARPMSTETNGATHPVYDKVESGTDWVSETSGRFKDDAVFGEIVRLGREFRESHPLSEGAVKDETG